MPYIDKEELLTALKPMRNRRSPEDQITIEMIKIGGDILLEAVRILLNKSITEKEIPADRKNAEII